MSREVQQLRQNLKTLQNKLTEVEAAYSKLEQRFQHINILYSFSAALSSIVTFDTLVGVARRQFKELLKIDKFRLILDLDKVRESAISEVSSDLVYLASATELSKLLRKQKPLCSKNSSQSPNILHAAGLKSGSVLVIPISTNAQPKLGVMAFNRNKVDSFKGDEIELIEKATQEFSRTLEQILLFEHTKKLSIEDELTGIFNRRYFNQRLEREVIRSKRYQRTLAVIMADIDHFKHYNDINGHISGDDVLKKVAATLESNLRKADIVCRFGGEEFIILLPEITKEQACKAAEKLRQKIERKKFEKEDSQPNKKITISLGVAVFPDDAGGPKHLLKAADKALYTAKSMGRNCVVWQGMSQSKTDNRTAGTQAYDSSEKIPAPVTQKRI